MPYRFKSPPLPRKAFFVYEMKNGPCNIKFNGKVVGWIRSNGESWIDDKAYKEMRKAYKALRNEQS